MATHPFFRANRSPATGLKLAAVGGALVLMAMLSAGCSLDDPTSPNSPAGLQGQNPNQALSFDGTVTLSASSASGPADGVTDIVISAQVLDAQGQPVQNLTPVSFATDLGLLRAFGADPATGAASVLVTTFSGKASVVLTSTLAGTASVLAGVGDVTASTTVQLTLVPLTGNISVIFRSGGGDITTTGGMASAAQPFRVPIVAQAVSLDNKALAGVKVRFRIVKDGTLGSGIGPARLDAPEVSLTDSSGEAFNQLSVVGEGTVVVKAVLIDPNTGKTVATSNQIISQTTTPFTISLTFSDGTSTSFSSAAPFTEGIIATLKDLNGIPVVGRRVRFTIRSDSTTAGASVTASATSNSSGLANGSVTVPDAGTTTSSVAIFAEVLDSNGIVIGTSNDIVATGT